MSPARPSIRVCLQIAGRLIANPRASSPARHGLSARRRSNSRRVESASAPMVSSIAIPKYVTQRLHVCQDTRAAAQPATNARLLGPGDRNGQRWRRGAAIAWRNTSESRPASQRVLLAGDYMGLPHFESAIETGMWAADRIIQRPDWLHVVDDRLAELRALQQLRAGHQSLEDVGHFLLADGLLEAANDAVGNFLPSHVLEHQHARQNDRAGIDLVLIGVLRRGAVRRFEDRVTCKVVNVGSRSDSDAADLRRERVGDVVTVQIHRGDDVEFVWASQHLLQGDIGDRVLDQQLTGRRLAVAIVPAYRLALVFAADEFVTPIAERALRELHDVA